MCVCVQHLHEYIRSSNLVVICFTIRLYSCKYPALNHRHLYDRLRVFIKYYFVFPRMLTTLMHRVMHVKKKKNQTVVREHLLAPRLSPFAAAAQCTLTVLLCTAYVLALTSVCYQVCGPLQCPRWPKRTVNHMPRVLNYVKYTPPPASVYLSKHGYTLWAVCERQNEGRVQNNIWRDMCVCDCAQGNIKGACACAYMCSGGDLNVTADTGVFVCICVLCCPPKIAL